MDKFSPSLLAFTLLLLMLGTGCTPMHISRTVSVKGYPPTDTEKIIAFKQEDAVNRPYQILGKVTYYRSGTRVTESASISEIRKYAAEIGADGVIGLHHPLGGVYSGIAVKWLAPGEKSRPKEVPFIIALLPFNPVNPDWVSEKLLQIPMAYLLDSRGYYLLPNVTYGFKGGISEALKLDDAALQNLGGLDTDFLMELKSINVSEYEISGKEGHIKVGHNVRVELLNKKTRTVSFRKDVFVGYFKVAIVNGDSVNTLAVGSPQDRRVPQDITYQDLYQGVFEAIESLPAIHDETSF